MCRFDSELLMLQEELRQEKQIRERLAREKELLTADKYSLEQNLNVRLIISKYYSACALFPVLLFST